jgi:hypothetical protein
MSKLSARMKNAANMAPVQEGLREGERLLSTLKEAAEKGDMKTANGILAQLKIMMTTFPSLPPGKTGECKLRCHMLAFRVGRSCNLQRVECTADGY